MQSVDGVAPRLNPGLKFFRVYVAEFNHSFKFGSSVTRFDEIYHLGNLFKIYDNCWKA